MSKTKKQLEHLKHISEQARLGREFNPLHVLRALTFVSELQAPRPFTTVHTAGGGTHENLVSRDPDTL